MKRFWDKVDVKGPDDCWEWQGALTTHWRNGRIMVDKKRYLAHRFSWILHNGDIPEGLLVCHHCDNPPCVNPKHLFLGTTTDNMRDMSLKGRSSGQKKTHCPQGHEYTPENTYMRKGGKRLCLACKRKQDVANQMKCYYQNHEQSKQKLRERYNRRKANI
jgi:hypothetical protein